MTRGNDNRRFLKWLEEVGLARHVAVFEEQEIDFDIAGELTDSDLKDIGLTALGDRKRFLKALAEWRPDAGHAPAAPVVDGERRQVTVLFADIAGYSTLSGKLDAEEIHALLNTYFDIADGTIRDFGGTIDKHIGDAVMAVFGAPTAHMDDPLRATLATLEIHRRLARLDRPIPVHIGIASGEVVASSTGSDQHREYTVTGSTANLASRLDGLAEAGETYVSEDVYRAVCDAVIGRAIGAVTVKGFDMPVSVWAIDGQRSRTDVDDKARLCGRESECGSFAQAAATCLQDGDGRLLYLRGEPGIGKSRLAEAFRDMAAEMGFSCAQAMILDFGAATGRQALRSIAADLIDPETTGQRSDMVDSALTAGLVTAEHEIHLYDLLDIPLPARLRTLYDAMDNETRHQGRQEALEALMCAASRRQPRFVLIDNLHWADDRTLSLVLSIGRQVAGHAILLVLTTRIEGDPLADGRPQALDDAHWMAFDLGALDEDEARAMARTFGLANPALVEECRRRAGGNPLFLEQLFRAAPDAGAKSLPASIQSVVLARMDSLDADDRKALQAASVLGQRFSLDELRFLIDQPGYECDEPIRRALVRPDGDYLFFAHALVVDGIYNSLLSAQRSALHAKVAAWYAERDAALHAQHLDRAGLPEAATAYLRAAEREADAYRYEPALALVERGLELAASTPDRVALLCMRGDLLLSVGQAEDSLSVFRDAVALCETPVDTVRALIGVAAGARVAGAVEEGMRALDTAEKAAGDLPLDRERAQIHYYRGTFLFSRGDLAAGLAAQEQAIEHGQKADDPQWVARGLSGLGDAQYAYGRMRTAHATFQRCVEICQALGYGQIEVANRYMVLNMRRYLNAVDEALDGMADAATMARRVGNLRAEMLALLLHGEMLTDHAAYDAALDSLTRALDINSSFGNRRMAAYLLNHKARALAGQGRREEAQSVIDGAWEDSRQTDRAFIGARICGTRALLATDPDRRSRALAEGDTIIETGVLAHNVIWFLRDAIESCLAASDHGQAIAYADWLEQTTRDEPIPWCDFFIERGRALAAHGQGGGDRQRLRNIVRQTREIGLLAALPALETALAEAGDD